MEWISCAAIGTIEVYQKSVVKLCDLLIKMDIWKIFTVDANLSVTYR